MERFKLNSDEDYVIEDSNGFKYYLRNDYNSAYNICKLLNKLNKELEANLKMACDNDSCNPYQLWSKYSELSENLQEQIENHIISYIKENWSDTLESYVEFHPYGCIEITVFDKTLDTKQFEELIISPLLELYTLKINGFETYLTDEDQYCYYEWHLGGK